jgi:hypothetical protein
VKILEKMKEIFKLWKTYSSTRQGKAPKAMTYGAALPP